MTIQKSESANDKKAASTTKTPQENVSRAEYDEGYEASQNFQKAIKSLFSTKKSQEGKT